MAKIKGAIEGESLISHAKASSGEMNIQQMDPFPGEYSGGAQLFWRPQGANETLTLAFPVKTGGEYNIIGHFTKAVDYGKVDARINGGDPTSIDLYHDGVIPSGPIDLGKATCPPGANVLTITTTGKNEKATGFLVGLDAIELKPAK